MKRQPCKIQSSSTNLGCVLNKIAVISQIEIASTA